MSMMNKMMKTIARERINEDASQVVCGVVGYWHSSERLEVFHCVEMIERCKIAVVAGDWYDENSSNRQ